VAGATQDDHKKLAWWANNSGTTGAPFDSYQILRGMRTLFERMEKHQESAAALAALVKEHKAVKQVYFQGAGGIVTFELSGGEKAARAFCDGLKWFTMAESLGGFESLVCHPPTMTHAMVSASERRTAGITDGLIRLSVGLEDIGDLSKDIEAALSRAVA
jgi:cystathionine gamma-synthase